MELREKHGELLKKKSTYKAIVDRWAKQYYALSLVDKCLYVFDSRGAYERQQAKYTVPWQHLKQVIPDPVAGEKIRFGLIVKLETKTVEWTLTANEPEDAKDWIALLSLVVSGYTGLQSTEQQIGQLSTAFQQRLSQLTPNSSPKAVNPKVGQSHSVSEPVRPAAVRQRRQSLKDAYVASKQKSDSAGSAGGRDGAKCGTLLQSFVFSFFGGKASSAVLPRAEQQAEAAERCVGRMWKETRVLCFWCQPHTLMLRCGAAALLLPSFGFCAPKNADTSFLGCAPPINDG